MYVIIHHLALAADEVFEGSVELDESYFGGQRKGNYGKGHEIAKKLGLK